MMIRQENTPSNPSSAQTWAKCRLPPIWWAVHHHQHVLFSPAGFIDLKEKRWHWLKDLPKENVDSRSTGYDSERMATAPSQCHGRLHDRHRRKRSACALPPSLQRAPQLHCAVDTKYQRLAVWTAPLPRRRCQVAVVPLYTQPFRTALRRYGAG